MFVLLFLPSAYLIEKYGANRAVALAMCLTTLSYWSSYIELMNSSAFLAASGTPFLVNSITKVSATWFGPRGRPILTSIFLMCFYSGHILSEFIGQVKPETFLPLAILSTIIIPIVLTLFYSKPDFSPTMSEEEKVDIDYKFKQQTKDLLKTRSYKYVAISSILLLVIIDLSSQIFTGYFKTYTNMNN